MHLSCPFISNVTNELETMSVVIFDMVKVSFFTLLDYAIEPLLELITGHHSQN